MFRNIVKLTLRTLYKNRLYTIINIIGLTIGLTVFLGILTLVRYETKFNENVPDGERIYRIYTEFSGAFTATNRGISNGVPRFIAENFPSVELVSQIHTWSAVVEIPQGDGSLKNMEAQSDLLIAPPSIFELVEIWQWEAGQASSFERPNAVVLLQSQAEKYFGAMPSTEYLGREIIYRDSLSAEVTGILSNPESETDFSFTDFISYATTETAFFEDRFDHEDWGGTSSSDQVFIKMQENASLEDLSFVLNEINAERSRRNEDESFTVEYKAQPLRELHNNVKIGVFGRTSASADLDLLRNVMLIAVAILILAIVNFVNLETAISGKRSREIGIRKVFGSKRATVITQFLVQSTIMTFVAILLAVPLTRLSMDIFDEFLPDGITFNPLSAENFVILLLIGISVGIISGFYPSLVMSSFNPVKVLKSNTPTGTGSRSNILRKGLTLFQFTFSQVLLIVTFIIFNQISYMLDKDMGIETENIMYFSTPYHLPESRRDVLRNELTSLSGIEDICQFSSAPLSNGWSSAIYGIRDSDGSLFDLEVFVKNGDSTYTNFFGIEQLSGHSLRADNEILINEALMKEMGFDNPVDVIGEMIDPDDDSLIVAGVIKDFNFRSLHSEIKPLAINLSSGGYFGIKFSPGSDEEATIGMIRSAYENIYPESSFESQYFRSLLELFYEPEERTSKLLTAAAGLALLISCLGLFGLSSYMSIQRTKEIGIRKVQGANVKNIIRLLTTDFLKLVVVAVVLAIPLAWWASQSWLDDYAYKAPFNIWLYFIAAIIALVIAFLTVSYHALTAARVNPVTSLRSE